MAGAVFDAIALTPADNVATVLRAVAAGEVLRVRRGDGEIEVTASADIPFRHKIALREIEAGLAVVKYGAAIGSATEAVAAGTHVHVHNLTSRRARRGGD